MDEQATPETIGAAVAEQLRELEGEADLSVIAAFNGVADFELPDAPADFPDLFELYPVDLGKAPPRDPNRGAWQLWMNTRRRFTGRNGGRPKTVDLTEAEVKERALEIAADEFLSANKMLEPYRARAVAHLLTQMESKDEGVAQRATFRLLDMTDGKPAQTIIEKQDGPRIIEYRTAALVPEFVPGAGFGVESPGDQAALDGV